VLTQVGLSAKSRAYPRELSGGEQQRVAIARALVNDPAILLADEPTGNLDERATRGVFQLLRDINAAGTAVLMATHNLDLVRRSDYRVIEINRGQIVYDSAESAADTERKRREDALDPDIAARLRSSSLLYLSGGNPAYLARILAGTPFWQTLVEELDRGLGYIGCSAGVACLGSRAPDSAAGTPTAPEAWTTGLELFPRTMFGPHWDRLDLYVPGLRDCFVRALPPGHDLVAIDEETALVGDGTRWEVLGRGGVTIHRAIRESAEPEVHRTGSRVDWRPPAL
jgi:cyanophycinase-like exopeptidase